jgi:hypothetical protein
MDLRIQIFYPILLFVPDTFDGAEVWRIGRLPNWSNTKGFKNLFREIRCVPWSVVLLGV